MTTSERLKILIPILGFGPQGGYRTLSELANQWTSRGHECTFLAPSTSPDPYFPTEARIIRFDRHGQLHDGRVERQPTGLDNFRSIWNGIAEVGGEYDVLLANHSLTAWPVRFAAPHRAKKFYYIQAYEPDYYGFWDSPVKKLLALGSYHLGLSMIANSMTYPIESSELKAVIPPGIDLGVFWRRKLLQDDNSHKAIVLGTVGRSEPYKGTSIVLAAYRKLRKERDDLKLYVALGNVEYAEDLEIVPITNDHELAEFYRSIDILLVACEGQAGAPHYPIIEAMASGVAVIHTGYFPGTDENSWPVEKNSADSIAEALRELLDAPDDIVEQKIVRAREYIETNLSWPVLAGNFLKCFDCARDMKFQDRIGDAE